MSSPYAAEDADELEQAQYRAGLTNELPPGFAEWPRDQQADYISSQMTRAGLIERILARLDVEPDRDVTEGNQRIKKEELAIIYIAVGGVTDQ